MTEEISLTVGDLAVDDRGVVSFVNHFSLEKYKRFYVVQNHANRFIRAWHGHRHESKAVFVSSGSALVCAVKPDDWDTPSAELPVERFVLSSKKPSVLEIPAGFANGFMTLSADTTLIVYSSSSLSESLNDDYRFPSRLWDPWKVEER